MKRKQAKKILLKTLRDNPDKSKEGMFIFDFAEGEIIKKQCTIKKCIEEVESETNSGKQLIDFVQRYTKETGNKL